MPAFAEWTTLFNPSDWRVLNGLLARETRRLGAVSTPLTARLVAVLQHRDVRGALNLPLRSLKLVEAVAPLRESNARHSRSFHTAPKPRTPACFERRKPPLGAVFLVFHPPTQQKGGFYFSFLFNFFSLFLFF